MEFKYTNPFRLFYSKFKEIYNLLHPYKPYQLCRLIGSKYSTFTSLKETIVTRDSTNHSYN